MSLLLSAYQLAKSYAGKTLFSSVSFGLEEKEKVALLGPNGVGKSTLLKILAKQMEPDSGEVIYKKGLRIAYLEQAPLFKPTDTISSILLNDHDLEPETLSSAYEWMAKLELSQFAETEFIKILSGGWQKRVALARELIKNPDLLILDEPTNHLDVAGIKWLEDFLNQSPLACLIVTHDRLFLQRVSQKILDLDPRFPQQMISVVGGYEKYLEVKAQMAADQLSREQKLANTLRREKEWLSRGAIARQTKQQARQASAAELAEEVARLRTLNKPRELDIDFKSAGQGPQKLVEIKSAGKKSYQNSSHWLFRKLNLVITPKTRVALLGMNGAGKSTLIKALIGQLACDEGSVVVADQLVISHFEQGRESLISQKSVLLNICPEGDYVDYRGEFVHARSYLERFGFDKNKADLPVAQLSGGEQARLRIAQLMLQKARLLILDEPTNDLDIETLDMLAENLKDFDGAVVLVSHDRFFMDQVCNQILAFDFYQPELGELLLFADYSQWESWFESQGKLKKNKNSTENLHKEKGNKKLSYKEKFELENIEANIAKLEEKIGQLQLDLQKPEISSVSDQVNELYSQLGSLQEELERTYSRWNELERRAKLN